MCLRLEGVHTLALGIGWWTVCWRRRVWHGDEYADGEGDSVFFSEGTGVGGRRYSWGW